jgi:perosamine synthetase
MKIPYGKHYIDRSDIVSVTNALKNKSITQGPLIEKFENKVCKLVKAKYAVAVSSCSAGLHIAVASLGRNSQNKNQIITSPISFVSTANAIIHNNLKPIFLDINKSTLNLDIDELKKTLKKNKRIKAIIPVHLAGNPLDSKKLYTYAKKKRLYIIEDAAHSFGAKYEDGSIVGSCKYSDVTVFSFHPVKTITTGEGGIVTTNSKEIYQKLLKLRSHGIEKNYKSWKDRALGFTKKNKNMWYYEMQDLGFNYRITDIQCALGISQLNKLNKIMNKRKKIAKLYDNSFKDLKNIFIPQFKKREKSSNHLYVLNFDFKKLNLSRNQLMKKLLNKNIITQVHYIPIPLHPYFKKKGYKISSIKNALEYYSQALSIPIFYNLNDNKQKYVINSIKKIIKK